MKPSQLTKAHIMAQRTDQSALPDALKKLRLTTQFCIRSSASSPRAVRHFAGDRLAHGQARNTPGTAQTDERVTAWNVGQLRAALNGEVAA